MYVENFKCLKFRVFNKICVSYFSCSGHSPYTIEWHWRWFKLCELKVSKKITYYDKIKTRQAYT